MPFKCAYSIWYIFYIVANNLTGANNFKFSALDTTLVLYTAITANEAKNKENAIDKQMRKADEDARLKEAERQRLLIAAIFLH